MPFHPIRSLVDPASGIWERQLPRNTHVFKDEAEPAVIALRESEYPNWDGIGPRYPRAAVDDYLAALEASTGKGLFPSLTSAKDGYVVAGVGEGKHVRRPGENPPLKKTRYYDYAVTRITEAIEDGSASELTNSRLVYEYLRDLQEYDIRREGVLALYQRPPPELEEELPIVASRPNNNVELVPIGRGMDMDMVASRVLGTLGGLNINNLSVNIGNNTNNFGTQEQEDLVKNLQVKVNELEGKQETLEANHQSLTKTVNTLSAQKAKRGPLLDLSAPNPVPELSYTTPGKPRTTAMAPIEEDEDNSPSSAASIHEDNSPSSNNPSSVASTRVNSPSTRVNSPFAPTLAPEEADVVDEGSPLALDAAPLNAARLPSPGGDDDDLSTSSEESASNTNRGSLFGRGIRSYFTKKEEKTARKHGKCGSPKQESPKNDMKPAAKKTAAKKTAAKKSGDWDPMGNAVVYDSDSDSFGTAAVYDSDSDSSPAGSTSVASPSVPRIGVDVEVVSPTVASPTVARVETVVSSPESVASEVSILAGGDAVEVVDGVLETLQEEATVEEVQSPARAAAALAALAFQPQPQPPLCHPIAARTGRPCKRCKPPIYCNNHRADAEEQNRLLLNAQQNNHNQESDDEEENEEEEEWNNKSTTWKNIRF